MADQRAQEILALVKKRTAKGGPGKTAIEDSWEDAIVPMAEVHARLAVRRGGSSEAVLHESVVAVIEGALLRILPEVAPDIRAEWEDLYEKTFWHIYHLEGEHAV